MPRTEPPSREGRGGVQDRWPLEGCVEEERRQCQREGEITRPLAANLDHVQLGLPRYCFEGLSRNMRRERVESNGETGEERAQDV
jgi:hypothetical protein